MLSDEVKKLEVELEALKMVKLKALETCKHLLECGEIQPWVKNGLESLQRFCGSGPKYTLHVSIDTDDDALIQYKGRDYCRYDDNLVFSENFENLDELANYLLTEIIIPEGYKASDYVRSWIIDASRKIRKEEEMNFSACGNQVMSIDVVKRY